MKNLTMEPNDPLTLEDLREMDGDPVWVERPGCGARWALVQVWVKSTSIIYLTCNNGMVLHTQPELESGAKIYRRKPEEEPQNSEEKPRCFYNDNGSEWCLGMAPEDMDEPIERCKRCAFCESGYSAEEGTE